jgi:hypothetical protein
MNEMQKNLELLFIRKTICLCLVFFICFPFVQILPLGGYTQPNALILSFLILPFVLKSNLQNVSGLMLAVLVSFIVVGLVLFISTCYPYANYQEYKYLSTYIGFPTIVFSTIFFLKKEKILVVKILEYSVYMWLFVALVQMVWKPDFMLGLISISSTIANDILVSGRGVLSLAPEPTHYAFHMVMLAAAIAMLGGRKLAIILALIQAVLLAKSASAVMTLGLGFILALFVSGKISLKMVLAAAVVVCVMAVLLFYFGSESRIVLLVSEFIANPFGIIFRDYSLNLRLGGVVASFAYIFNDFIIPHGMSHEAWLSSTESIKLNNTWLVDISAVGPPSGIGIILYQAGFLMLLQLVIMLVTIFRTKIKGLKVVIVYAVPFVVLGQYYISAPLFAFIFAITIIKNSDLQLRLKY